METCISTKSRSDATHHKVFSLRTTTIVSSKEWLIVARALCLRAWLRCRGAALGRLFHSEQLLFFRCIRFPVVARTIAHRASHRRINVRHLGHGAVAHVAACETG